MEERTPAPTSSASVLAFYFTTLLNHYKILLLSAKTFFLI